MIYRTVPFSMTLNDPYPGFKVTTFFDAEYLRNGTYSTISGLFWTGQQGRTEAPSSKLRRREDRGAEGVEWGTVWGGVSRPQTHFCHSLSHQTRCFAVFE